MKTNFEIGDEIKIKDKYNEYIYGHIVLIISAQTGLEYYCSMYLGAEPGYYWIKCVDPLYPLESTLQALNKFNENQLEHSNIKKQRKLKIKKLNEILNESGR